MPKLCFVPPRRNGVLRTGISKQSLGTRSKVAQPGWKNGSVWESNPLRALFKPSTGFEDQGPHQRCKHSRGLESPRKPRHFQDFLILPRRRAAVYVPSPTSEIASRRKMIVAWLPCKSIQSHHERLP